MSRSPTGTLPPVIQSLLDAVNDRDLSSLVACFGENYANETPAHPDRGFRGRDQVHHNWTQIFAQVPDVHAHVSRYVVDGSTVWTEWAMAGTRRSDASAFQMTGVVIYKVAGGEIESASFYLEPVERVSGDVNVEIDRAVGLRTNPKDRS
jgi:hypothetical protein